MIYKFKKICAKLKGNFIAQPKNQKRIIVFIAVIFVGIILTFIISGIDSVINGVSFFIGSSLFFQNVGDAFMDFFNVNYFMQDMDPYMGSGSSYPPMILLFAKLFQLICGSAEAARDIQFSARGIIALCIYFGVFAVCAWLMLRIYMKKQGVSLGLSAFLYCALALTAPMMFAIDRGNYLLYDFLFLGYFLLYYRAEKRWQRELSYLSLALAVSFKIYPAIFAVLLLNKKDWAGLSKVIAYSILLFILPMLAFEGGLNANFSCFISNLLNFQSQSDGYYIGEVWYLSGCNNVVSIPGIALILCSRVSGIPIAELPSVISTVSSIVTYIFALVVIASVFITKKQWVKIFLLTSIMTFVLNTNYEYNLIFFIFPLLMFFTDDEIATLNHKGGGKRMNIVYSILFALIFIPLPMGYLIPKMSLSMQHGYPVLNFVQVIAYLTITIILVVEEIKGMLCLKRQNNKKVKNIL